LLAHELLLLLTSQLTVNAGDKYVFTSFVCFAFSSLMLFVGWQEGHLAWFDAGVVMCLGQVADLHKTQLMPLPLTYLLLLLQ